LLGWVEEELAWKSFFMCLMETCIRNSKEEVYMLMIYRYWYPSTHALQNFQECRRPQSNKVFCFFSVWHVLIILFSHEKYNIFKGSRQGLTFHGRLREPITDELGAHINQGL